MGAVAPEVTSVIRDTAPPPRAQNPGLHLLSCHGGCGLSAHSLPQAAMVTVSTLLGEEGCVARVAGGKVLGIALRCPREGAGHAQPQVHLPRTTQIYTPGLTWGRQWQAFLLQERESLSLKRGPFFAMPKGGGRLGETIDPGPERDLITVGQGPAVHTL